MRIADLETIIDMQSWCRTWHPMDPGISVQNQNFTRNPEKLANVPGTSRGILKSFTLTIPWNSQSLWRPLLESLHVYTTPIGDQRYCRKSSAQSKGRHLCCIVAIGSKWKLVGRFNGMLYLSAKRHRSLSDGKTPYERRFWQPFKGHLMK